MRFHGLDDSDSVVWMVGIYLFGCFGLKGLDAFDLVDLYLSIYCFMRFGLDSSDDLDSMVLMNWILWFG